MNKIFVKAPTRIDFGGGTLDIWPLYLLHEDSCTINMAIDLFVEAELFINDSKIIEITLNEISETINAKEVHSLPSSGAFGLINHIIKYFSPFSGFQLNIKVSTPPGSGLGTSSSLAIVLCKAFSSASHIHLDADALLKTAMNLETQILQLPTGNQDYLAALYGGINTWKYEIDGWHREVLPVNYSEIQKRSLLCYVGKPHDSGLSNWITLKKRLEKDDTVITHLEHIKEAALAIRHALIHSDWDALSKALNREWENRKKLSSLILIPEMEKALRIAFNHGCLAAKGCGAANGGSLYLLIPPEKKELIKHSLLEAQYKILDFTVSPTGITAELE